MEQIGEFKKANGTSRNKRGFIGLIQGWATQECHFGWPACIGLGSAPEAMPFCRRLVCECLGTPLPPSRQIGIFGSLWGGSENRRGLGVFWVFLGVSSSIKPSKT